MKRFATAVCGMLLSGCAHTDTGHIDYRVADPPSSIIDNANGGETRLQDHKCPAQVGSGCAPIVPARVVRRYMPPQAEGWNPIKAGRVFSIEIEQGDVGNNISEGHFFGEQLGKHAEIAILANVFEFAATNEDAAKKRFIENAGESDDPSDVELKLIYFSKGVEHRQAFNFSNIPLMKRSRYGGGSIGIQIVVMEVDAKSGPFASLLQTLARFGQQLAPGPTEAKDLIFDLGESLLAGGSKDDKLFDYRFVLSAEGDDPRAMQATFAPGRYVLRRTQDPATAVAWDKLRLDHNTGRLLQKAVQKGASGSEWEEFRDDLYLTLNIRSYPIGTEPEFYDQQDWTAFRKALQLAADASAPNLGKLTADVQGMLETRRSSNWGDRLLRQWATVQNRLDTYGVREQSGAFTDFAGPAACTATAVELTRRRDLAKRDARDALRSFAVLYKQALKASVIDAETGTPKLDAEGKPIGEFRSADREAVVSAVAPYFMPWTTTEATQGSFDDASAFEAAFFADATPTLDTVAMTAAMKKFDASGPKTCEALLAR